jgi:hypothetical protein
MQPKAGIGSQDATSSNNNNTVTKQPSSSLASAFTAFNSANKNNGKLEANVDEDRGRARLRRGEENRTLTAAAGVKSVNTADVQQAVSKRSQSAKRVLELLQEQNRMLHERKERRANTPLPMTKSNSIGDNNLRRNKSHQELMELLREQNRLLEERRERRNSLTPKVDRLTTAAPVTRTASGNSLRTSTAGQAPPMVQPEIPVTQKTGATLPF